MSSYLLWESLIEGATCDYIFPEKGVAHNRDQQFGYPAHTTVIQLQPTAPHILRTTHTTVIQLQPTAPHILRTTAPSNVLCELPPL